MTKEEAIKRIKDWNLDNDKIEVLSVIIPELKESEDERIRKEIISFLKEGKPYYCPDNIRRQEWAAWLEKRGEQKSADTPKFKVGDSIKTASEEPLTITEITDNGYWSEDLFICSFDDAAKWELVEQNPAWSKEDEMFLNLSLGSLTVLKNRFGEESGKVGDCIHWLKSLKERMQPQPKQELSEDAATNEYIELGLPSGTLWKLTNEEGYYTFDEAIVKFGGGNIPNKEQWEELRIECKWTWVKGKNPGYRVTGPNGNSIFLPAAGIRYGTEISNVDKCGDYWSSTYNDEFFAWCMCFDGDDFGVDDYNCHYGRSVRLVK